jgi:hypothetical protein
LRPQPHVSARLYKVLPDQKSAIVEKLTREGRSVATRQAVYAKAELSALDQYNAADKLTK